MQAPTPKNRLDLTDTTLRRGYVWTEAHATNHTMAGHRCNQQRRAHCVENRRPALVRGNRR
jgi:hypothetical protein